MPSERYPVIVGRYAVYDALAAGGMATVHLGRLVGAVGFTRTVAIKRMRADYLTDPEFISMFADEARVAGRIRHPNVVPVIDVIATEKELLLVMEYVEGETLARLLQLANERGIGVPPAVGAAIVRDALAGLHAAHETKDDNGRPLEIIHRDVSPQNVIVGVDGVARVLDFGVAKAAGRSQVTREGNIKGKLAYMSPEQLSGNVSRATDTFASSIVLWEVLTGQRLFRGETDAETLMKVLAAPVVKPSEVRPGLGTTYDAVVMKGLSRDVSQSFATAREMATALAQTGGLADAAEIGEWVTEIARERLRQRNRVVARVESADSSGRMQIAAPDEASPQSARPAVAQASAPAEATQLDATSGVGVLAPARAGRRLVPLGAALVLVLAGGALTLDRSRPRSNTAAVDGATATTQAAPAETGDGAGATELPGSARATATATIGATATPPASGTRGAPPSASAVTSAGIVRALPASARPAGAPATPKSPSPRIPDHL